MSSASGVREYYVHSAEGTLGPFSGEQLCEKEKRGELTSESYLWREGLSEWRTLEALRDELTTPKISPPAVSKPSPAASQPSAAKASPPTKSRARIWIAIAVAAVIALILFLRHCGETPFSLDERIDLRRSAPQTAAPADTAPPPLPSVPSGFEVGRITFLGAASQVSGSCHLIELEDVRFIIDAGAFLEDPKTGRAVSGGADNYYGDLTVPPAAIDFLLLTHAHADHMGRIPWLFAKGARPTIVTTAATRDLLRKTVPDLLQSTNLPGDELYFEKGSRIFHTRRGSCPHVRNVAAERIEKWNSGRAGAFARDMNLCSWCADAEWREMENRIMIADFGKQVVLTPRLRATYYAASHMLGAAWIKIEYDAAPETTIVITASGDLGDERNILFPRTFFDVESDFTLVESTYGYTGEEAVPNEGRWESFRPFIEDIKKALAAKKLVLIPAFVEDRSHKIIAVLQWGMKEGLIPSSTPIFLTSSTAAELVDVYANYATPGSGYYTEQFMNFFTSSGLKPFRPANLQLGKQKEYPKPSIVIAHSAMMEHGESFRLLEAMVDDPSLHVINVGYQARNTPGAVMKEPSATKITLAGRERDIRATRSGFSNLFSSHSRGSELIAWLKRVRPRARIFIIHGERRNSEALGRAAEENPEFAGKIVIPRYMEHYPLVTDRIAAPVNYAAPRTEVDASQAKPAAPASSASPGPSAVRPAPAPAAASRIGVTSIRGDEVTISGGLTVCGVVKESGGRVKWPPSIVFRNPSVQTALAADISANRTHGATPAPLIVTKIEVKPVGRGSLIADATVELNGAVRLEGIRLMKKSGGGDWVAPPSEKAGNDWKNHARFSRELEEILLRAIKDELKRLGR